MLKKAQLLAKVFISGLAAVIYFTGSVLFTLAIGFFITLLILSIDYISLYTLSSEALLSAYQWGAQQPIFLQVALGILLVLLGIPLVISIIILIIYLLFYLAPSGVLAAYKYHASLYKEFFTNQITGVSK